MIPGSYDCVYIVQGAEGRYLRFLLSSVWGRYLSLGISTEGKTNDISNFRKHIQSLLTKYFVTLACYLALNP